jgi:hypothetical protein
MVEVHFIRYSFSLQYTNAVTQLKLQLQFQL